MRKNTVTTEMTKINNEKANDTMLPVVRDVAMERESIMIELKTVIPYEAIKSVKLGKPDLREKAVFAQGKKRKLVGSSIADIEMMIQVLLLCSKLGTIYSESHFSFRAARIRYITTIITASRETSIAPNNPLSPSAKYARI